MHLIPGTRTAASGLILWACLLCAARGADGLFADGLRAYSAAEYSRAAEAFRASAGHRLAAGTLQNLGNAEWQLGHTGEAILAWERALWADAYNHAARHNLKFARRAAQVESPALSWYEIISTWLPVNWWPWITGISLWGSLGAIALPALLGKGRSSWNQALAAFGLMLFLLSLPALLGVKTRSKLGFVLQRDTPLLLTPTRDGQAITRLGAGDPARLNHFRGEYVLVRAGRTTGWLEKSRLGLICSDRLSREEAGPTTPPGQ